MYKWLEYKLTTVLLVLLLAWLSFWAATARWQRVGLDKQVRELENKITITEQTNKQIIQQREYYSNPAYLERQARLKFNYQKDDEQLVLVYASSSVPMSRSSEATTVLHNIQKWWYYLIGK